MKVAISSATTAAPSTHGANIPVRPLVGWPCPGLACRPPFAGTARLEQQQATAVEAEDFESAASLDEQLRQLAARGAALGEQVRCQCRRGPRPGLGAGVAEIPNTLH